MHDKLLLIAKEGQGPYYPGYASGFRTEILWAIRSGSTAVKLIHSGPMACIQPCTFSGGVLSWQGSLVRPDIRGGVTFVLHVGVACGCLGTCSVWSRRHDYKYVRQSNMDDKSWESKSQSYLPPFTYRYPTSRDFTLHLYDRLTTCQHEVFHGRRRSAVLVSRGFQNI